MIITQVLGPEHVTTYYLPQKVFGVINLAFSIIMVPMWSSFTQANASNDVNWIKETLKNLVKVWSGFCVIAALLLLASPFLYHIWVGEKLANTVSLQLSALVAVFVCVASFSTIFLHYINGIGKVMLQLIMLVVAAGLNIPLSVYFAKNLGMGNSGVILASILCIGIFAIVTPIQAYLILNNKASGIWNK
jgi:O-antigen/teichoic acid export membrane protein